MSDRRIGELPLRDVLRSIGRRAAVATGALAALISLFNHVPISVASWRGAAAYGAVLLVTKLGLFAFERARALERMAVIEEESSS